jgi:hypothetical protein
MKRLYEAADRIEAQLLVDFLAQHHIPAVIFGDYLSGGAGELPAMVFPAVWLLEDADLVPAERRLQEFLRRREGSCEAGRWRCPRCAAEVDAQLDLCWRCLSPRP